jgi:hypothetical protein|tara:strand:+ start:6237 stop:6824 length:588 start_codon:yes stop_codon:yes gene_type:complete
MGRAVDTYITYQFIRILTLKWEEMPAYKYGIIDDKGKLLRKYSTLRTNDEKDSYTIFHRVVWNLKRILEKLPFGRTKLASYAAGLFLLKEKVDSKSQLENNFKDFLLEEGLDSLIEKEILKIELNDSVIKKGEYVLLINNFNQKEGDIIEVIEDTTPSHNIFGMDVYSAKLKKSGEDIMFSKNDVKRLLGGNHAY